MGTAVTAIITTHNRKDLLCKAIESVLNQNYQDIEIIVIDDASDDGTEELVKIKYSDRKEVEYIRIDESKGGNFARNTGIQNAHGEYIALLDDDDEWLPDKILKQVDFLNSHPDYDVVSCNRLLEFDFLEKHPIPESHFPEQGDLREAIWYTDVFVTSTLMFRNKFLKNIGMFDENLHFWQDYELMMRSAQKTNIGIILEPLVLYRVIQKDKNRLTNNVVGWEKAVEYINNKHKLTIDNLAPLIRKKYMFKIAEDGMYRSDIVGDAKKRKKYLKQILGLNPTLKNFYKYLFNTIKVKFWEKKGK